MLEDNPACKLCGSTVAVYNCVSVKGDYFHQNCFKCKQCKKRLTPETWAGGQLYCQSHAPKETPKETGVDKLDDAPPSVVTTPVQSKQAACHHEPPAACPASLDPWCDPARDLNAFGQFVRCGSDVLFVYLSGVHAGRVGLVSVASLLNGEPVPSEPLAFPEGGVDGGSVDQLMSSGDNGPTVALCGQTVYLVTVSRQAGSGAPGLCMAPLTRLPEGQSTDLCASTTNTGSLVLVCFSTAPTTVARALPDPTVAHAPRVLIPPPRPARTIACYTAAQGWTTVCTGVQAESDFLACNVTATNELQCAYTAYLGYVAEEAERGEFFGFSVPLFGHEGPIPVQEPRQLTVGAGRVDDCKIVGDGLLIFLANFSLTNPITTHRVMFSCAGLFNSTSQQARNNLTPITDPGSAILFWGRLGRSQLYATVMEQGREHSFVYDTDTGSKRVLRHAIVGKRMGGGDCCFVRVNGIDVFMHESATVFPSICLNDQKLVPVPQPEWCEPFTSEWYEWENQTDGTKVHGFLYAYKQPDIKAGTRKLIVHAHGGPAVPFFLRRSDACSAIRYPCRQLLVNGYTVFLPIFRGTLGVSDGFAAGNIGCQGLLGAGDVGDIIDGTERLLSQCNDDVKPTVGVWGGSYGGYLTLRLMGLRPDLFVAGCSLWPYISNRTCCYITGDTTWEDEYSGLGDAVTERSSLMWPLTDTHTKSDVYNKCLHKITGPVLFIHGEDDDVCPISESVIACNVIREGGAPSMLVGYPTAGHGLSLPQHCRDRDLRILNWFQTHF